jgi:hypothetical protein
MAKKGEGEPMGRLPNRVDELNVDLLNDFVSRLHPTATVVGFEVTEVKKLGEHQVSTTGRVRLRLRYGTGSPRLPEQVVAKMVLSEAGTEEELFPTVGVQRWLFQTEIKMYQNFLPEIDIEKPLCLAAEFDEETGHQFLMMEDLSIQRARFPNVLQPSLTPAEVARGLELLAKLHAKYWKSPKLDEHRTWLSSLTEGGSFDWFDNNTVAWIDSYLREESYRRDFITRVGRPPSRLWENVRSVHRYHEQIFPITLQHGDTGAHNSYHLPDGRVGFLDWQISVRATWPHDVHYHVCTGLSIADRRAHQKELVAHYLKCLADRGVNPIEIPDIDLAMQEFSRALIWGLTVGWLLVPERAYGMSIISANLERLMAACTENRTFDLADEVTKANL